MLRNISLILFGNDFVVRLWIFFIILLSVMFLGNFIFSLIVWCCVWCFNLVVIFFLLMKVMLERGIKFLLVFFIYKLVSLDGFNVLWLLVCSMIGIDWLFIFKFVILLLFIVVCRVFVILVSGMFSFLVWCLLIFIFIWGWVGL